MKDYNTTIKNASKTVDLFLKKTFLNISFTGPPIKEKVLNSNPIMIVCSHRSHLDYILLGVELYKAGLKDLRFAAGDNLTHMPYIGKKFRSWGAYTVYRARAQSREYIRQLCYDVIHMLNNNNKIIVFPEGGRSYNGNMMNMKHGFISANIFAQHRSPEKQFYFLPVSISYEKIPELAYFDLLQKGKKLKKGKENIVKRIKGNIYYFGADLLAFAKFIIAHKFGINYGKVFIDYGTPISINDIIDLNKHFIPGMRNEFAAHKITINKIGEEIKNRLESLYRILPMHVLAVILGEKESCTISTAVKGVPAIMDTIHKQKLNSKSLQHLSHQEIIEQGIQQLKFSKAIQITGKKIIIKHPQFIKYYAATIKYK